MKLEKNIQKVIIKLLEKRKIYSIKDIENPVYLLSKEIYDKLVIIYGETGITDKIAVRIKGQICENAKMLSYVNVIPEMNHNEIVGWENNPQIFDNLFVLWLYDKNGQSGNKNRFRITQNIFNKLKIEQFTLSFNDKIFFERFFHFINFGDWLSYWCAILHQTDPSPVEKISFLKEQLNSIKEI